MGVKLSDVTVENDGMHVTSFAAVELLDGWAVRNAGMGPITLRFPLDSPPGAEHRQRVGPGELFVYSERGIGVV